MTPGDMWAEYSAASGVEARFESFGFASDEMPGLRDELAELVRSGPKRATAGRLADFDDETDPLPRPGDYWVVTDSRDEAVVVIRTTQVDIAPFGEVDAEFAWDEGEGDRTLGWWRRAHEGFFEASGTPVDDSTLMVLERFEKVWPR